MKKTASIFLALSLLIGLAGCSAPATESADPKPTATKESPKVKPAEITDYSIIPSYLNWTGFSALIYNPNETETLFDIEVEVLGIGENDVVLGRLDFSIGSLQAGETWVLQENFAEEDVMQAEFKVSHGTTDPERITSRLPEKSFSGIETDYRTNCTYDYCYGIATTNVVVDVPEDAPYSVVIMCAAYFGKNKVFLGGNCEGKDVFAGRKNGFEISDDIQPNAPTDVKLYARYGS